MTLPSHGCVPSPAGSSAAATRTARRSAAGEACPLASEEHGKRAPARGARPEPQLRDRLGVSASPTGTTRRGIVDSARRGGDTRVGRAGETHAPAGIPA